jgi:hypothetical protein
MIHRVHIKNFQSHEDTTLEFHPGVNAIIGPSDQGKSAVFRALHWALCNQPQGDDFRRRGTKQTEVEVQTGKREAITRTKTASVNTYALRQGGVEKEYKSFKSSVPEDITTALNLSHLSWQHQHDAPFLLSRSPGEVARELNKVINLDAIDRAYSFLDGEIRSTAALAKLETAREDDLAERLSRYGNLDEAEGLIVTAETLTRNARGIRRDVGELKRLLGERGAAEQMAEQKGEILPAEKPLLLALESLRKAEGVRRHRDTLENAVQTALAMRRRMREYDSLLKAEPLLRKAAGLVAKRDAAEDRARELAALLMRSKMVKAQVKRWAEEEKQLRADLPKVCPTCGKELG